ncbi:MAG: hypothetical protein ACJAWL_002603 [Motiliproteus sp.]|jgi:hypothetical protein
MPKIFLYLAAAALLGFIVTQNFFSQAKTWEPFYQGCIAGAGATEARCSCFTDYVHERLGEAEINAVLENRVAGARFQDSVEQTVQQAGLACQ